MAITGEIRPFAGALIPNGWRACNGDPLTIAGNEGLALLLGTTYGGDGVTNIKLPDLRGRCFIHGAPGFVQAGQVVGSEEVKLQLEHLAAHSHPAGCNATATTGVIPAGALLASGPSIYLAATPPSSALASATVQIIGGGLAHPNVPPWLAVNFIICVAGIAPIAGIAVGGSFTNFGGMLQLVAFTGVVMAGYARTDGQEFVRAFATGLFSLIGVLFGIGDGSTTANLPNLLGKTVNGAGTGSGLSTYAVGDQTGEATHALITAELPSHSHPFIGLADAADNPDPFGAMLAASASFIAVVTGATMASSAVGTIGQGLPHDNRSPSLAVTELIAVDDVDPDFYVGEIIVGPWVSAPTGTLACDGSSHTIAAEPNLFAVIGYTYGHGSSTDFKVPDGRGRNLVGANPAYPLGQSGGVEGVALSTAQTPSHSHPFNVVSGRISGQVSSPVGHLLTIGASSFDAYRATGSQVTLNADAIRAAGGGGAHENRGPQVAFNFYIVR